MAIVDVYVPDSGIFKWHSKLNPLRGKGTLYNFTLANARWFYSSQGWAVPLNDLTNPTLILSWMPVHQWAITISILKTGGQSLTYVPSKCPRINRGRFRWGDTVCTPSFLISYHMNLMVTKHKHQSCWLLRRLIIIIKEKLEKTSKKRAIRRISNSKNTRNSNSIKTLSLKCHIVAWICKKKICYLP